MKILEDIDLVHVVENDTDPDDIAFGRYKPVASFKTYPEAEAFIKGYDYRLGELLRAGQIMDFSDHDAAVARITSASGSSQPELPFEEGGLAGARPMGPEPDAPLYYSDGEGFEVWQG